MYRMQRIVPLIGPRVAGPLGAIHLPRMWLKGVYSAAGMLYEGYFDNYRGFNQFTVDGLGLEPDPWFDFLKTMPTYPQAEAYVREHGKHVDAASVAALNAKLLGYERPEEAAAQVRDRAGLDAPNLRYSAVLIDYDDWTTMHDELVAHKDEGIEPLVPMVSSGQTGTWGIPHLPRLWFKAFLAALGALPSEWKTCANCGFDKRVAGMLGFDVEKVTEYVRRELPTYVQFENWLRTQVPAADEATRAAWAAEIAALQKNDEMAAADIEESKVGDASLRGTILLNDLVDWRHMHDHAVAHRTAVA